MLSGNQPDVMACTLIEDQFGAALIYLQEARPSDMLVFGTRKYLWSTVLEQRPSSLTPSVAVSTLPVECPKIRDPENHRLVHVFFLGGGTNGWCIPHLRFII